MILELAAWLEGQTDWVRDKTLFVGHLPQKDKDQQPVAERCVVLLERTPARVDGQQPDRQDKPVQVWNRARTYFTARADAEALYILLHGLDNIDLPSLASGEQTLIMILDAMASPAPIAAPNPQGLFEFSTNYMCRAEDPS